MIHTVSVEQFISKHFTSTVLELKSQLDSTAMETADETRNREIEMIHKVSLTLNCDLDRRTVAICVELFEYGIDPESIADGKVSNMLFG